VAFVDAVANCFLMACGQEEAAAAAAAAT